LCNAETTEDLDIMLCAHIAEEAENEKSIEEFHVILKTACDKTYKKPRTTKKTSRKSVPWWTEELTILRKRTNALRRRHQITRNNDDLRERRKLQYLESKAQYAVTIKREKIRSWKEYCNIMTAANPWNKIYKLAAGKRRHHSLFTSLRKPDGSLTTNMDETVNVHAGTFYT
jgi:hypothetical protein